MKELKSLYNGIMNDFSIQRYSMGWEVVIDKISKKYKIINRTDEVFSNSLVSSAILVSNGTLQKDIISFAQELSINSDSLSSKNIGTQRSPFGIGS